MTTNTESKDHGSAVDEHAPQVSPAPKWTALINDCLVPMPRQIVRVAMLREQGSIPAGHGIFRDHNSENDPPVAENGSVDLAAGNVFYSDVACERAAGEPSHAPAKLAYVVDDRWEVVIKPEQTGRSLRDLFALSGEVELLRDLESPDDLPMADAASAAFHRGCVFRTRRHQAVLEIKVNRLRFTEKDGVKPLMKGREIAKLVEEHPDQTKVEQLTAAGPKPVGLDEEVTIVRCDEFKVIRCNINAGFQAERLERELTELRARGARVSVVGTPVSAVIYHDVPVRDGLPASSTDVLVKVPAGYPGGIIDNAFLPEGSPLLSRTPGGEQQVELFEGRSWKQKSIHPYTGNGIPWNKDRHGFHTYYTELVNWLNAGK
jgi:hypothetical protein